MTVGTDTLEPLLRRAGPGARAYRAPGRVNIIGEHVDYVGGLVLPFACDTYVVVACTPRESEIVLTSLNEPGVARVPVGSALQSAAAPHGWPRYVWGVARALAEHGRAPRGIRGVIRSDIPVGAGMSSSAALEAAVALALLDGGIPEAHVLQRAEHIAVGVPCGIMDQVAVLEARAGHAVLLDCTTLRREHVAIPDRIGFVVVDTGTRRVLEEGRYARRRGEAEAAIQHCRRRLGCEGLADLRMADVPRSGLAGEALRRLRHLVGEQQRVTAAVSALRSQDGPALGHLVNASHDSLRDDFEVSSPQLDLAVQTLRDTRGCLGARLLGAGFAGCVLGVVEAGAEQHVADRARVALSGSLPRVGAFPVRAVGGAAPAGG